MIDLCPLGSSTRNTYVKKYVSVVVPTTDRARTLNSRPFQSQMNSIFYSFHVLTFLLPKRREETQTHFTEDMETQVSHQLQEGQSHSQWSWWTAVNSAQSYSTLGTTEIQIRPGRGVTRKSRRKEIPTHNLEPRYPHSEKKRPEREREAALFVLKKDIWISQWESDLGVFPVFQLDPTMQLLARGAMSQPQIGAQSLCPCALLSARPHSLPPHPAKLA